MSLVDTKSGLYFFLVLLLLNSCSPVKKLDLLSENPVVHQIIRWCCFGQLTC